MGRRESTLPGFHQWDSAFNAATGMLYLPTPNDDAVTVVDTKTRVVSTVGTGTLPMAAAVNTATNRVYVVNYGSSDVTVDRRRVAPPDRDGRGRAVAAADRHQRAHQRIYVVNTHADSVSVIDGGRHHRGRHRADRTAVPGPWRSIRRRT